MASSITTSGRPRSLSEDPDGPTKRISTPAGMRLSVVMQNTIDQKTRPRRASKTGTLKSGIVSKGSMLVGNPRESTEEGRASGPMGYSYDIFSEKSASPPPSLATKLRRNRVVKRIGGLKRLLLVLSILLLCLIAVAVGAAVGLKHSKKSASNANAQPDNAAAAIASGSTSIHAATATSATPAASQTSTVANLPSGFPAGTYSFSTFLDTVNPDCTSNPATWSCYPYAIYNDDHAKSLATFDWVIKEGSTKGSYSISSLENPFDINFENAAMKLVNKDGDSERYQFQISMDKVVVPGTSVADDGSSATCFYNATTMTGYLYTKRASDYPSADEESNAKNQAWPFAVRVEQTVAGGENVPNCYRNENGGLGEQVGSFTPEDPSTLCSCLYRNFLTPGS